MIKKLALLAVGTFGISSLMADTLYLKNGQTLEGTYMGGTARSIRFNSNGATKSYLVTDVEQLEFEPSTLGSSSTSTSSRWVSFENASLRVDYPDNWQVTRDGDNVMIAPSNGRVNDRLGNPALAYGVTIDMHRQWGSNIQGLVPRDSVIPGSLEGESDRIVQDLRQSNPNMRLTGSRQEIRVDNRRALKMTLVNDSPNGGRETDWLVTVEHPQGVLYMVFTAPERDFSNYQTAFQRMLSSVRLVR
jgi:hypothetical protein